MKQIKIRNLGIILLFTLVLGADLFLSKIFAVEPTPTSSAQETIQENASSSAQEKTVKQNIKDRIEKVIEENGQPNPETLIKKAFVGQVERVTAESLSIKTLHGDETVRLLPEETTILLYPKLQSAAIQDIEIDGYAIVMGFMDQDQVLLAKRVLVSSDSFFPKERRVLLGTIQDITSTVLTLILRTNETQEIPLNTKTLYKSSEGEKIKRTSLDEEQGVLVVIPDPENASSSASLVRVLTTE